MKKGARFTDADIARFPGHIQAAIRAQLAAPHAVNKSNTGNAAEGTVAVEEMDAPVRIHVHHIRHRAADIENLYTKHIIDGIVRTGLLRDDRPEIVSEFRHTQEVGDPEETIITIEAI